MNDNKHDTTEVDNEDQIAKEIGSRDDSVDCEKAAITSNPDENRGRKSEPESKSQSNEKPEILQSSPSADGNDSSVDAPETAMGIGSTKVDHEEQHKVNQNFDSDVSTEISDIQSSADGSGNMMVSQENVRNIVAKNLTWSNLASLRDNSLQMLELSRKSESAVQPEILQSLSPADSSRGVRMVVAAENDTGMSIGEVDIYKETAIEQQTKSEPNVLPEIPESLSPTDGEDTVIVTSETGEAASTSKVGHDSANQDATNEENKSEPNAAPQILVPSPSAGGNSSGSSSSSSSLSVTPETDEAVNTSKVGQDNVNQDATSEENKREPKTPPQIPALSPYTGGNGSGSGSLSVTPETDGAVNTSKVSTGSGSVNQDATNEESKREPNATPQNPGPSPSAGGNGNDSGKLLVTPETDEVANTSKIGPNNVNQDATNEENKSEPNAAPQNPAPSTSAGGSGNDSGKLLVTPETDEAVNVSKVSSDSANQDAINEGMKSEPNAAPKNPAPSPSSDDSAGGSGSLSFIPKTAVAASTSNADQDNQDATDEENKSEPRTPPRIPVPSPSTGGIVHSLVAQYDALKNKTDHDDGAIREPISSADGCVPLLVAQYNSIGANETDEIEGIMMNEERKGGPNEKSDIPESSSSNGSMLTTTDVEISTDKMDQDEEIVTKEQSKIESNGSLLTTTDTEISTEKMDQDEEIMIEEQSKNESNGSLFTITDAKIRTDNNVDQDEGIMIEEQSKSESSEVPESSSAKDILLVAPDMGTSANTLDHEKPNKIDDESKKEEDELSQRSGSTSSKGSVMVTADIGVSTNKENYERENAMDDESESEHSESLGSFTSMDGNTRGTFLYRLETSLITDVDVEVEDFNDEEVIDIEEFMDLKLEREKFRRDMHKKRKKKVDVHQGVDPRLFPSYYVQEEEEKSEGNDDESSIEALEDDDVEGQHSSQSDATNDVDPAYQVVSAIQGRKIVQLCVVPLLTTVKNSHKKRKAERMLEDSQNQGVVRGVCPGKDTTAFASPARLLELENGRAILVRKTDDTNEESPTIMNVLAVRETVVPNISEAYFLSLKTRTAFARVDARDLKAYKPERGLIEGFRRDLLRQLLVWSLDGVNALNLGRAMQSSIPSLTGYESYLMGQVLEVLDATVSDSYLLDHVTEVLDEVVPSMHISTRTQLRMRQLRMSEFNEILRYAFKSHQVSRIILDNIQPKWDFNWHWFQKLRKIRLCNALGQTRFFGVEGFPASENFPSPVNWVERFWTPNPNKVTAQNLGSEFDGVMNSIRNQFGTHIGRIKTNDFRIANRLPVDESIVHSFVTSPMSTMINNGAVHVLRQLAKHWHAILEQPFGNWAHHRMEQLNPFQTMRFHIPNVCIVLSSLRGRNVWDSNVLCPFVCKCQKLTSSLTARACLDLAEEMQSSIVHELCAGVEVIENSLSSWLQAIQKSCRVIEEQAKKIYEEITGVELGIRLGFDLITQVSWKIPEDKELDKAILLHVQGKYPGEVVNERNIRRALLSLTPRDKRTLKGLVKLEEEKCKPAKILIRRVRNLLKRDIRREFLNDAIRELSTGEHVFENNLTINDWYWLNEENEKRSVYIFVEEQTREDDIPLYRFVRVDTGTERFLTFDDPEASNCQQYIPVAEAIVRAQRCYMNLELDYCRQFQYDAFMECSFLRTALKRLAVVSQIFCDELDNARLNLLQEVKSSNQVKIKAGDLDPGNTYYIHSREFQVYAPFTCKKRYSPSDPEWKALEKVEMVKVPPQSMAVVGTNVTGLMTVIHCAENVLASGGQMKLHESTDESATEGSLFERAQIVRLDARWIAMLRYHLGSVFEDIFIPTPSESDSYFGNHLATEGTVEVSIKYLECILHAEVTRLLSKEIIEFFPGSNVQYDPDSNSLMKFGEHLEVGDKILRHVDPNGKPTGGLHRWKITNVIYTKALGVEDLRIGEEYGVYNNQELRLFTLSRVDLQTRTYVFESKKKKIKNIEVPAHALPPVYPKGTERQSETVFVTCETKGESNEFHCDRLSETLKGHKFVIDVGHSHLIDCARKSDESSVHFEVTPSEPYGVCCITRLNGSIYGKPTRFVGGSRKLVRQTCVADEMVALLQTKRWQQHFEKIVEDSDFSSLNDKDPIFTKLVEAVEWHGKHAGSFRRHHLQTQIFETGDNFYLGMELTREYEKWKNDTVDNCLLSEKRKTEGSKKTSRFLAQSMEVLKGILTRNIDHLWFEASLEVLRKGGVYDSPQMPRFQLVNSLIEEHLNHLSVGDNFREAGKMRTNFQLLFTNSRGIFARTPEGMVRIFDPTTNVLREGALSRSTDNDTESKIAITTFPVSHCVNHRCIRLNNASKGYVIASFGNEQSTSHFMRYDGLSGGCFNIMHFNNFVKAASDGVPLIERFRLYSQGTNWSNGEIIEKGTMTSFGQDAFLRPGFSFTDGMKYLRARIIESMEAEQDVNDLLSRRWKVKFAASMIPRGMELNGKFISSLIKDIISVIFDMFLKAVLNDDLVKPDEGLEDTLKARRDEMSHERHEMEYNFYWNTFIRGLEVSFDGVSLKRLKDFHCEVARRMEHCVHEVIDFAKEAHLYNQRFSQELWNQPKSADSIVEDFALQARNFPNTLTLLTTFSATSVALCYLVSPEENLVTLPETCGFLIGIINVLLSFGILSKIRQYKNRNEEARAMYCFTHYSDLKKTVFRVMDKKYRLDVALDQKDRRFVFKGSDPYLEDLEQKKHRFMEDVMHYDLEDPDEFIYDYRRLLERKTQPDAFKHFQKLLVTYYISDVYQINSNAQERLVEMHKVCDEIRVLLAQEDYKSRPGGKEQMPQFFDRISEFGDLLKHSDQLGISSFFRRFICCCCTRKKARLSSITNETLGIIKDAEIVSKAYRGRILKRQILDLEYLYRASVEMNKAFFVFVLTWIIFVVSIIFVISRIVGMTGAGDTVMIGVGIWSQMVNIVGGLVSLLYFVRNLYKSLWLWVTLSAKIKRTAGTLDPMIHYGLRQVRSAASAQVFLTTLRFSAVLCSIVALPWAIVLVGVPMKAGTSLQMPLNIALVGFFQVIGSVILSFLFEYFINYNLPPTLGKYVCEAFREEIQSMYITLSTANNKFDTRESRERVTWDYVARAFFHKYRFDLIFGADRFGAIFQYLNCGIEEEEESERQELC